MRLRPQPLVVLCTSVVVSACTAGPVAPASVQAGRHPSTAPVASPQVGAVRTGANGARATVPVAPVTSEPPPGVPSSRASAAPRSHSSVPPLLDARALGAGWGDDHQEQSTTTTHQFCGHAFRSDAQRLAYAETSLSRRSDWTRVEEQSQRYRSAAAGHEAVAEFRSAFVQCTDYVQGSGADAVHVRIDPYDGAPCSGPDTAAAVLTFTAAAGVVLSTMCVSVRDDGLVVLAVLSTSAAEAARTMDDAYPVAVARAWD